MRCARALLCILAALAVGAGEARATTITVVISGTWDSVDDTAGVLDGSATSGTSFTATLVYDDGRPDLDDSDGFGAYVAPAVSSDLSIVTGHYSFSPGSDVEIGVENDNDFGEDWIFLFADNYAVSGPLPAGVGVGSPAYTNPTLVDFSGAAHSSDALVGLNWNLGDYDDALFYLYVEITGRGPSQHVEFNGTITSIEVLPEPGTLTLAGIAGAALFLNRRRG